MEIDDIKCNFEGNRAQGRFTSIPSSVSSVDYSCSTQTGSLHTAVVWALLVSARVPVLRFARCGFNGRVVFEFVGCGLNYCTAFSTCVMCYLLLCRVFSTCSVSM